MENQEGRGAHIWAVITFQNTRLFQLLGVPYKSKKKRITYMEVVLPSVRNPAPTSFVEFL
jgi:hypothetical protein